jgi:SAM-dependent methyltransferase
MSDFGSRDVEFHRLTAGGYDAETTSVYGIYHRHSLYPFLDRLVGGGEITKALDMGCGTGVVTLAMAERGLAVTGIDHSPDMLALARATTENADLRVPPRLEVGDITKLDFADETFDLITCQGVLHHLAAIEPTMAEMRRLLRPGGYFYVSEPCTGMPPPARVAALMLRGIRMIRKPRSASPDSVEAPIDPRHLTKVLQQLGLEFDVSFMTHLPGAERLLPDWARLVLTRTASAPWRRRRGNLVFVEGHKPT